jgi:hypothetical protein
MTLNETLLQKLNEWRPSGAGRHGLATSDDCWTVSITADRCDSMGCRVWELALARKGPTPAGLTLRSWAERTSRRVTALMEQLKVVEIDERLNEAQLRSQDPNQRGDQVYYYEVLLRATTTATLRRYQACHAAGTRRDQMSFALTHDALVKLVDDLVSD